MSVGSAWIEGLEALTKLPSEYARSGSRWEVLLTPAQLVAAAAAALAEGYFLEDVSVLDVSEGFCVVYHFDHWENPGRVTLKVVIPHDQPEIPTISHIHSGADWHERESFDFFGVIFTGHPNLKPLLLPDDLGFHPLLKKPEDRKSLKDLTASPQAAETQPRQTSGESDGN